MLVASFWTCVFAAEVRGEALFWHASLPEALAEAKASGKPLFLEFRCAPCVNGREFDAQVYYYTEPDSPRGKLMSRYVLARVTSMSGVNIAHYDRDWHNSLYYFIINGNEDIYLRYGGRDEVAADTYLNLDSLELALTLGLSEHEAFKEGRRASTGATANFKPEDIGLLNREVIQKNRCTECHLIADYSMQEKAHAGLLDPISDLYRSPDIKRLGLYLDVPKGLLLKETKGAAADAGIMAGDTVASLNGTTVLTFGDLQYQLDKVPRLSPEILLGVKRNGELSEMVVTLPREWWKTDLEFRHWTVEPQLFFESRELQKKEKEKLRLPEKGFASEVTGLDIEAAMNGHHDLEIGDIVISVDGRASNPLTSDPSVYIKLFHAPNSVVRLGVLRAGKLRDINLKTGQMNFRKAPVEENIPDLSLGWSETAYLSSGKEKAVGYRAAVVGEYLLVQARHFADWHSFAMDNAARLKGRKIVEGNQELPTEITIDQEIKGGWLQTEPTDFSDPEMHWFTWGFQGVSYFAVKLATPEQAVKVNISAQACRDDICAGAVGLELEVPASPAKQVSPMTREILDELTPLTGK
ncbi:Trx7/PDZ domain-containing (seleno)protein [Luteolibacter algae]|uniref:Trx7/PDZ domain-containing (seleno)protein n=1 Tax=Luteolibacter algae TaxID=454151 RepID=UPI0036DD6716